MIPTLVENERAQKHGLPTTEADGPELPLGDGEQMQAISLHDVRLVDSSSLDVCRREIDPGDTPQRRVSPGRSRLLRGCRLCFGDSLDGKAKVGARIQPPSVHHWQRVPLGVRQQVIAGLKGSERNWGGGWPTFDRRRSSVSWRRFGLLGWA